MRTLPLTNAFKSISNYFETTGLSDLFQPRLRADNHFSESERLASAQKELCWWKKGFYHAQMEGIHGEQSGIDFRNYMLPCTRTCRRVLRI